MRAHSESVWQTALRYGLIGGLAAVLLSLIGMVEAFGQRAIIGGVLSMGQTFLAAAVLLAAYAAARRLPEAGTQARLSAGALAGAIVGVLLAALVLLGTRVDLRSVFANASSGLYNVLTFGQAPTRGMLLLVMAGLVLGLAGAALLSLSPAVRRTVIQILVVVVLVGLLADLLRIIISKWGFVAVLVGWMFSGRGLSVLGTLAIATVIVLLEVLRQRGVIKPRRAAAAQRSRRQTMINMGLLLVVLLALPLVMGTYVSEVLDQVGLYILMGLGLNIVVGFAGLLDLGYVGFFAIGAYVMGMLTSPEIHIASLGWWAAMPIAVGAVILAGVILGIPVLNMRGDYLAIVTLGFGEIIRLLAQSDALRPWTGGSQGIQLIAKPAVGAFVFDNQVKLYYLLLAGCLLAGFVAIRLRDSRLGRAWMAVREDEDVAQAIGINLVATKLLAFATGAALGGLSGTIFAAKLGAIYANSFGFLISINVLSLIIIGGMGSIPGVIIGGLALVGLPELLREFAEFRLLVYGAILVLMMLYRPEGLWPEEARRRELHVDEGTVAPDAIAQPAAPGEASIEAKVASG
jgi:branched-chain amino acid transport system permease protein